MSGSSTFYGDPKVIISLFALLIAIASFIVTLSNQWDQDKKWEELNTGNPQILEIKLINWREFTRDEAVRTNWGYEPLLYEKGEATDIFLTPYYLVAREKISQHLLPTNVSLTIAELQQELRRINYNGEVVAFRLFKPRIGIENMGKTEVKNLTIIIDAKLPDQDWQRAFTSGTEINLMASQKSTVTFTYELPLGIKLPDKILFKIKFSFTDYKNRKVDKIIGTKWTSTDNFWSYESVQ